jgi:hypothetical protein
MVRCSFHGLAPDRRSRQPHLAILTGDSSFGLRRQIIPPQPRNRAVADVVAAREFGKRRTFRPSAADLAWLGEEPATVPQLKSMPVPPFR